MCPKGSGPHSAAKRCAPNKPSGGSCARGGLKATFCSKTGPFFSCDSNKLCPDSISGGHILGKGPPRDRAPAQSKTHILRKEFDVAKSGLHFQIPKRGAGLEDPRPRHLGARILRSENGPSSAPVCPKASGPHSAPKQRRFFRVPPINHPEACVPKAVQATFCSKTGPFFSCDSNKFCPTLCF